MGGALRARLDHLARWRAGARPASQRILRRAAPGTLSGQQIIGEFGIGLAAAVLLDVFLLRTRPCCDWPPR
jgi:hypothetical protein